MPQLNRLVYWVGMPCLIFVKIAIAEQNLGPAMRLIPVFLGVTFIAIALGYLSVWLLGIPQGSVGAFVQAFFRGNLVFVGLPIVVYSLGNASPERAADLAALAILVITPVFVVYNIAAVLVLVADAPSGAASPSASAMLREVAINPLIISAVLGTAWMLSGWGLLSGFERALSAVGSIALPLALLGVGATLRTVEFGPSLWMAITGAVGKTVVLPIVAWFCAGWAGLGPEETQILLIFSAAPGAVAGYVMAERLKGDAELAASGIVLSTLFSLPVFVVILLITGSG